MKSKLFLKLSNWTVCVAYHSYIAQSSYNIILLIVTCYILVFFYNVFPTFVHIICDAACISHFLFVFHSMLLQSNLLSFYRVYKVVIQSLYYMSSRSHSVSDIVFLIVFRSLVFRTRYLFELVFWRITFDLILNCNCRLIHFHCFISALINYISYLPFDHLHCTLRHNSLLLYFN